MIKKIFSILGIIGIISISVSFECSSSPFKSLGGLFKEALGVKDISVTEENIGTFEKVPFEMVINKAFYEKLKDKKLRCTARYKGTAPNPGNLRHVDGFININLCDIDKTDVCSDLIIVKEKYADTVFALENNQSVELFGSLLEPEGFGSGGTTVKYSQLPGGRAPNIFFWVYKISPTSE